MAADSLAGDGVLKSYDERDAIAAAPVGPAKFDLRGVMAGQVPPTIPSGRDMRDEITSSATESLRLRDVVADDLPTMFQFQLDPESNRMAAVIPRNREAFFAVWNDILADPAVVATAIVVDDEMVGQIGCFQSNGLNCVGYWIGRAYWGRGIASRALELFLKQVSTRPLHARVARHNVGSIRILEKNGFKIVGYEHSPGTERYLECDEVLFLLE